MKKIFAFVFAAFCIFPACSKQNSAGGASQTATATNRAEQRSTGVASEDLSKLERVLAAMSPKCRDTITKSFTTEKNKVEFIVDLKKVLATEIDDIFLLVDKKHYLPDGYVPKNLVPLEKNPLYDISRNNLSLCDYVSAALEELAEAATADGIKLMASSTYRSYEYQTQLFNRYVAQDGMERALRYSAPPGASQHQLGVAVDFGTIDASFAKTKEGVWLFENAAKHGWSLSFPEAFEDITGYMWECWHYRYIGKEACDFQKKWFADVQQFMLEFINEYKKIGNR